MFLWKVHGNNTAATIWYFINNVRYNSTVLPVSCIGQFKVQTPAATSFLDPKVSSTPDMPQKPHQPNLIKFHLKDNTKKKRKFNHGFFDKFKLLHYHEDSDSVCTMPKLLEKSAIYCTLTQRKIVLS